MGGECGKGVIGVSRLSRLGMRIKSFFFWWNWRRKRKGGRAWRSRSPSWHGRTCFAIRAQRTITLTVSSLLSPSLPPLLFPRLGNWPRSLSLDCHYSLTPNPSLYLSLTVAIVMPAARLTRRRRSSLAMGKSRFSSLAIDAQTQSKLTHRRLRQPSARPSSLGYTASRHRRET